MKGKTEQILRIGGSTASSEEECSPTIPKGFFLPLWMINHPPPNQLPLPFIEHNNF